MVFGGILFTYEFLDIRDILVYGHRWKYNKIFLMVVQD